VQYQFLDVEQQVRVATQSSLSADGEQFSDACEHYENPETSGSCCMDWVE
jgi:hypothetical protein